MKSLLLIVVLALGMGGCKTINKDALAAWTAGDVAMMQDLSDYRKAAGKPVDDITAHLAKPIDGIAGDEEAGLMAEILADVLGDSKKSDTRKQSYALKIQTHLNLFHSLKGS